MTMSKEGPKYVLALDIGTTTIRSIVYDGSGAVVGAANDVINILAPHQGWCEIDPDDLWSKVVKVMRGSVAEAGVTPGDLSAVGISSQRGTFTTWNRRTGKHYHNFVTWKDVRADSLVKDWNNGVSMKLLRAGGKLLHGVSRMDRYKVGM